jgi:hypothetical protein
MYSIMHGLRVVVNPWILKTNWRQVGTRFFCRLSRDIRDLKFMVESLQQKAIMRLLANRLLCLQSAFLIGVAVVPCQRVYGEQANMAELRAQFFKLCDVAIAKVTNTESKGPFFVDSYAVRALSVAYDMTGNPEYLNACRAWSERMVQYQEKMIPPGAYYMHYNRKPGEKTNDWYSADGSSIGMAVLATSVRCQGAEQKRFVDSAEQFAGLVLKNYVKASGGTSDGIWSQSSEAWWCSSALFGSFLFNLYAVTGDRQYLRPALDGTDWLNKWDPTKDQPFPLVQQGPAMIFYVMENYSAGWPYIEREKTNKQAALAKAKWCLDWIAEQQGKSPDDRLWPTTKGWGMKFGGLPFHEYVFSRYFPAGEKLTALGDAELQKLASIVFAEEPKFNQLSAFMMMSYAERLDPGAIYRAPHRDEVKPAEGDTQAGIKSVR